MINALHLLWLVPLSGLIGAMWMVILSFWGDDDDDE